MLVRYLPLIFIVSAIVLALAPLEAAAQPTLGSGVRTEMTPVDRETHNGVFDRKPRSAAAAAGLKPSVSVGDVQPVTEVKAEDVAREVAQKDSTPGDVAPAGEPEGYVTKAHPYTTDPPPKSAGSKGVRPQNARPQTQGAPVDHESQNKALPPGADAREVRPAQAFPPDRIERAEPQAPSKGGIVTQAIPPKPVSPGDDPRSKEEDKDPGD